MSVQTKYRFGRSAFRTFEQGLEKEWLLTNGIGGFANSTIIGASSRVFSSYLIASLHPPVDRMLIWAKTHEEVVINDTEYDLAAQQYPGQLREGQKFLNEFTLDIIPTYTYQVNDLIIHKSIVMEYGKNASSVCYEVKGGATQAELRVIPLFHCRPFNTTAESKKDLEFQIELNQKKEKGGLLILQSPKYPELTIEFFASTGTFYDRSNKKTSMATPNYLLDENEVFFKDQVTGFTGVDHMATPYEIHVMIPPEETVKFYVSCSVLSKEGQKKSFEIHASSVDGFQAAKKYQKRILALMDQIPYKDRLAKRLAWAADAFLVDRESTGLKTILAGFPWFCDWGRDTMIALSGLTMATGRLQEARSVLESFSKYVKDGMIPNVFPNNASEEPGYNTIDASLWYFYAVDQYLKHDTTSQGKEFIKNKIYPCLKEIITYYQKGTAYGIHMDEDGLIEGGSDLDQLTWMDVRVGDVVVTPRHGKPVEINALWYNALKVMENLSKYMEEDQKVQKKSEIYSELAKRVKKSFRKKFWNSKEECLYDVITVLEEGSKKGKKKEKREVPDDTIRPNQIYAISLPYTMLPIEKEKKVVQKVYEQLYTPYGIRSLSPKNPEYKDEYTGKLLKRDMAYHMGTAWAYLSGAFITAYCKVGGYTKEVLEHATKMCEYFEEHMEDGCLNGIAEIFDGDFSCTGRGCYTQAWSVGEILRVYIEEILPRV